MPTNKGRAGEAPEPKKSNTKGCGKKPLWGWDLAPCTVTLFPFLPQPLQTAQISSSRLLEHFGEVSQGLGSRPLGYWGQVWPHAACLHLLGHPLTIL